MKTMNRDSPVSGPRELKIEMVRSMGLWGGAFFTFISLYIVLICIFPQNKSPGGNIKYGCESEAIQMSPLLGSHLKSWINELTKKKEQILI